MAEISVTPAPSATPHSMMRTWARSRSAKLRQNFRVLGARFAPLPISKDRFRVRKTRFDWDRRNLIAEAAKQKIEFVPRLFTLIAQGIVRVNREIIRGGLRRLLCGFVRFAAQEK